MPSAWVERVAAASGTRYRVKYRTGGRETAPRGAGTFKTRREALIRRDWVGGELASMRVPDLALLAEPTAAPTVRDVAERWLASRIDISENTRGNHRAHVATIAKLIGARRVDSIAPADVVEFVARLCETRKRETIRKQLLTLGMVLDHAGITPNPARDKSVKLPHEDKPEMVPPTAAHVLAVHHMLPERYRLPLVVLDSTGMRLNELEQLAWGDIDEPMGRWRVTAAVSKTNRPRWVEPPSEVFAAVLALVAREDRTADRRVFQGFGGDRFRTAVARACMTTGVPAFSPHDLRHRRISLWHRQGESWATIGQHVGQRDLSTTANTYTHVLADDTELDLEELLNVSDTLARARGEHTPVLPSSRKTLD